MIRPTLRGAEVIRKAEIGVFLSVGVNAMKLGTFKEFDFLAIGPYCWGRGKTPKQARNAMKSNYPGDSLVGEKSLFTLYRLTDATDQVEIHEGWFNVDSGERPYYCGIYACNMPPKFMPDAEKFQVPRELQVQEEKPCPLVTDENIGSITPD